MKKKDKYVLFDNVLVSRLSVMFFFQAIALIMADKAYTSANLKRERDNFQVQIQAI